MVMIKPMFTGKLGVIRLVTSHQGFTGAFSIRVFITKNVVPTVIYNVLKMGSKSNAFLDSNKSEFYRQNAALISPRKFN